MENKPHEFSPFIIGMSQFPDESNPEYFVQAPNGKIVSYHFTYDDAFEEAIRLKTEEEGYKN